MAHIPGHTVKTTNYDNDAYATNIHSTTTEQDIEEVTKFMDASGTGETQPLQAIKPQVIPNVLEDKIHDIPSILQRPHKIIDVTMDTSSTGDLASFTLPFSLMSTSVITKIQNFRFFRANYRIKVMVNASPFALGRLVLAACPWFSAIGSKAPASVPSTRLFGYPCMEHDIGTGTTFTMTIPFSAPYHYFDLTQTIPDMYSVSLRVLNQLLGSSSGETADVSIYGWFEDIELGIPIRTNVAQSGTEIVEKSNKGLISGPLRTVSKVAGYLSPIPAIGAYATGVSWFAGAASRVADALGYSKPMSLRTMDSFQNVPLRHITHSDGIDSGTVLALKQDNAIVDDPGIMGSQPNELEFSHICTKLAYIETFDWNTTSLPNANIHVLDLVPTDFRTTPFGFCANHFSAFRGGIVVRISFVKNAFFVGRLEVEFRSGTSSIDENGSYPTIVLDIRKNNEFLLKIPYHATTPFLSVGASVGTLQFRVINPLRAPPTVPQEIPINIYVGSDKDIAFAFPQNQFNTAQGGLDINDSSLTSLPTSAMNDRTECDKAFPVLSVPKSNLTAEVQTFGESIVSVRQLIKRSSFTFVTGLTLTTTGSIPRTFDPSYFGDYGSTNSLLYFSNLFRFYRGALRYKVLMVNYPRRADGNVVSPCYMKVTLTNSNANVGGALMANNLAVPPNNSSPLVVQEINLNPALEFTVPYYNPDPCSLVTNDTRQTANARPVYQIELEYEDSTVDINTAARIHVYVSAGDDFSFGFQVGPSSLV